jgi:3-methyl-2-oxobutanoate hydroxymethyltransferase
MLGLYPDFVPKHTKRYAELAKVVRGAVEEYMQEVRAGAFPTAKESFAMDESVLEGLDKG